MIKEKRRKSGLTALEIVRINPQGKFLRVKTIKDTSNLLGLLSNKNKVIIKYCSSTDLLSGSVVIYFKKHSGIAISSLDNRLIDLEILYCFRKEDYFRSLTCVEPEKYIFKFANIIEIFGLTLNILKNGKSSN